MADVRKRTQSINNVDYVNEMIEVCKGATATNSEYLDPDEMVRTACVVNSVYYYLKMEGKDPGSFVDFYIRMINAGAPKGVWRVAGTSTAGKGIEQRGKTVRDIMELEGRSFQSFYYGTPKSKR